MPQRPASSGHSKLKQSLVLRDYLLNHLGLDLPTVTRRLRDTESLAGAEDAFVEGRYVETLRFLASRSASRLSELDTLVREACQKAKFTPRYFQYLSLLFAAEHLDRIFADREQYLDDLNSFHASWTNGRTRDAVAPFTGDDLQRLAFWMATAAGKTHILHACLVLAGQQRFERIILITPTEQLSRQHAEALRKHCQHQVFVYPLDGDASQISSLLPGTVLIIDINKLTDNKQGEGVSLDAGVFKESRNLVFVDEGHKGQRNEGSVWKRIQQSVAGVGHPQARYQGLLIEFSATFGQVAEAEHAFDQYAKSVVFDYAYDRFHADMYGKDFQVLNLKGNSEGQHEEVLAASLVTYWHQMNTFRNPDRIRELQQNGLLVEAPLWVLLGLSVIGGKSDDDKAQTSDVIEVILFLKRILCEEGCEWLAERIRHFASDGGKAFLPDTAKKSIDGKEARGIADHLLKSVFGYSPGTFFVLRHLKSSPGEVALGLSQGNRVRYFGVVNVGDASGLATALESYEIEVETDAFRDSLFAALEHGDSGINLLVGSRRFSEGWNNYRASTLTLLRLGSGEGPLIIQMFGRVVRFRGKGDMKRLATPGLLGPLQTAYVYGLRADYMEKFLAGLTANGIDTSDGEPIPTTRMDDDVLQPLKRIFTTEATKENFRLEAKSGSRWYNSAGHVTLSLHSGVHRVEMLNGKLQTDALTTTEAITEDFKKLIVPILNYDRLLFKLLEFRNTQGWWNFSFDADALRDALKEGKYSLEGTPHSLRLATRHDLERHHHLALNLLQRMVRSAYRRSEAKKTGYRINSLAPPHEALVIKEIKIRKVQA